VAIGAALPIAISTQPSHEWRLAPGIHVARVSGADHYKTVGAELGVEARLTPSATGRFEWIVQSAAGVSTGLFAAFMADAPEQDRAGGYLRLSLALRFRLSMQEFTGQP